jgi:hypothetical protein
MISVPDLIDWLNQYNSDWASSQTPPAMVYPIMALLKVNPVKLTLKRTVVRRAVILSSN